MSYPGVARRWRAASPPVTYGVALRAFWDTTTYTGIAYIVVNEKLNFVPKRVYMHVASASVFQFVSGLGMYLSGYSFFRVARMFSKKFSGNFA